MSYLLSATTIKPPQQMDEVNSTQVAQQRSLSGAVNRDYFGSNKRVWTLNYRNMTQTDYTTINTIYQSYLTLGTAKTWQVTEPNYTVSLTNVHIDLISRKFSTQGADYISDFDLILTEA